MHRLVLIGAIALAQISVDAEDAPGSPEYFENFVRPILAANCIECHGPDKQEGDLRLDTHAFMLEAGRSGEPLVTEPYDDCLMLSAIRHVDFEMPPERPLPEADIAKLEAWIKVGAPWPEHAVPVIENLQDMEKAAADWWAIQPLVQPNAPRLDADRWSQNSIDRFILASMREHDIEPAPRADMRTLVRRLYVDLIGMPPTAEEWAAYENDTSADPWGALVDRLLDDPRYGEHWARFWLDLARYSESDGWNKDSYRPHIWRYRDYVVDAFNNDKPYPEFVREQLAGDEMPGDDPDQHVATGFLRLGIYEYNQRDAREQWNDIMNEITDVAGNVFMGLSMSCSRCHDHKFDPITQKDYFALRAFFEPMIWTDANPAATQAEQEKWQQQQERWKATTVGLRAAIDELCAPYYESKWHSTVDKFPLEIQDSFNLPIEERKSWDHQMAYLVERQFYEEGAPALASMSEADKQTLADLKACLQEFDNLKPAPLPVAMSVIDFEGTPSPTTIPGDESATPIPPAFLSVLSGLEAPEVRATGDSTGRRTALAEWIGNPDNPLTTRLIVNRIWQQHFGRGIAPSANDLGRLGQSPTHPDLLDWLTQRYIANGWRMKDVHRLIVHSATWQQSSNHPQANAYLKRDPSVDLRWRFHARRLRAEELRDAILRASGELDLTYGGPSVTADKPRRGLYVRRLRNSPDPLLHSFDSADGLSVVAQRNVTTTPTQALLMTNGDYVLVRAARLADRLMARHGPSPDQLAEDAFVLALGRPPTPDELERARTHLVDYAADKPVVEGEKHPMRHGLLDVCHVLLNTNEFIYVD